MLAYALLRDFSSQLTIGETRPLELPNSWAPQPPCRIVGYRTVNCGVSTAVMEIYLKVEVDCRKRQTRIQGLRAEERIYELRKPVSRYVVTHPAKSFSVHPPKIKRHVA